MKTILLAGATGLIGTTTLDLLLKDARIGRVVALVRKPMPVEHAKLEQWVANGDLLTGLKPALVDAVICCLGTTIRNVGGDQAKFSRVDKDLVVGLTRWAVVNKVPTLAVVSAIGADPKSRIFYSRTKGEMEEVVIALGLSATHFFHPSILTGPRKEERTGERIGIAISKVLAPLMVGGMRKYRPMPHDVLAKALINAAVNGPQGVHRHSYDAIVEMAGRC
jgi:uncharacterized protein YbjT (DUF2867 family)